MVLIAAATAESCACWPALAAVQLHPWTFEKAASGKLEVENRMQPQYDHSYYTIATFIDDHLAFHAKHLTSS
jgi:S-formylglutathione hydrolase